MNMHTGLRKRGCILVLLMAGAMGWFMPATAAPVGNPREMKIWPSAGMDGGTGWGLLTDVAVLVGVSLTQANVLRVQAGRNGKLHSLGNMAVTVVVARDNPQRAYAPSGKFAHELIRTATRALRLPGPPHRHAMAEGLTPAAVMKPERDIRDLQHLRLRTVGAQDVQPTHVYGNWVDAVLIGQGDGTATIVSP